MEGIFHFGHDTVSTISDPLVLKGTCLGNDVRASNLNYYILKANTNAGNRVFKAGHTVSDPFDPTAHHLPCLSAETKAPTDYFNILKDEELVGPGKPLSLAEVDLVVRESEYSAQTQFLIF